MCFSATASFSAASVIGSAGILTLSRIASMREMPLAGVPLLFAVQQAIEGALWLSLPHAGGGVFAIYLANSFAVVALVVWPVYAPVSAALVERDAARLTVLRLFMILGALFAAYSARDIMIHPYHVVRAPSSLCYINNSPYPIYALAIYLPATCGGFLISSQRMLQAFGTVIAVGLVAALAFFFADLVSVWCFFAALASSILALYFLRRDRVATRTS
jgi:hypothetical protein